MLKKNRRMKEGGPVGREKGRRRGERERERGGKALQIGNKKATTI